MLSLFMILKRLFNLLAEKLIISSHLHLIRILDESLNLELGTIEQYGKNLLLCVYYI